MRRYQLDVNGKTFTIIVREYSGDEAVLEIDGTRYVVHVDDVVSEGPRPSPIRPTRSLARGDQVGGTAGAAGRGASGGAGPSAGAGRAGGGRPSSSGGAGSVTAPIPGQILKLLVSEGDEIAAGKPVLIMEAMKMENVINAPVGGKVGEVRVHAGDAVTQGQELLVIY